MKINDLTSRLIDRKAIKERGEVAQGSTAHTHMAAGTSSGHPQSFNLRLEVRWLALFTARVLIFLRSIPVQAKGVSASTRSRKTSAKRKTASIILAQGAAEHRYILVIWLGQRGPRNPKTVLVKCPDGKVGPVGSAQMLVSRVMAGLSPFDSPLL